MHTFPGVRSNRDQVSNSPQNFLLDRFELPQHRLSRIVPWKFPSSRFNPANRRTNSDRIEPIWYTQGSERDWSNNPGSLLREENSSPMEKRLTKEEVGILKETKGFPKDNIQREEMAGKQRRPQIEYKEFDLFKSPDLPEITWKLITPGQGLQKSVYIILLLSAAGFVFQAWSVLSQYFAYDTVTVLAIIMPDVLTAPAISICFPYPEIVDKKKILEKYPKLEGQPLNVTTLGSFVTIKDIFELTPKADVDVTIASCAFRTPDSPQLFETNLCDGIMSMNKFFKQQFTCYDISLVTKHGFRYRNIRNSLSSAG